MPTRSIRLLQCDDVPIIAAAFAAIGWNKPAVTYMRYLSEQEWGERVVLVAFEDCIFAGYLTIVWHAGYRPFRDAGIPEITDLNVLPAWRRRGIGGWLMDEAERRIAERPATTAGIGVGMYPDYGSAQRFYVRRGYCPDGRGLTTYNRPVVAGETVTVDDGLVLYFTKRLSSTAPTTVDGEGPA